MFRCKLHHKFHHHIISYSHFYEKILQFLWQSYNLYRLSCSKRSYYGAKYISCNDVSVNCKKRNSATEKVGKSLRQIYHYVRRAKYLVKSVLMHLLVDEQWKKFKGSDYDDLILLKIYILVRTLHILLLKVFFCVTWKNFDTSWWLLHEYISTGNSAY